MKYFKFGKLVRDNILPLIQEGNQKARGVKVLDDEEFITELIKKAREEIDEMGSVSDKEDLKKEFADVSEVLDYLKEVLEIGDEELLKLKQAKRSKNGGFDERTYIKDVGAEEDNKWYQYYLNNPDKYPEVK